MSHSLRTSWLFRSLLPAVAAFAIAACDSAPPSPETTARVESPVFTNGGFEVGAAGAPPPAPWVLQRFLNAGITVQNPQTRAGLNLMPGGNAITTEIAGVNQPDPDLGVAASLRWSRYGNQCARVNFHSNAGFGNPRNVNSLSQTMTIGPGDVDPFDGLVHIRATFAPVLQNPGHPPDQQPYYFVQVTNVTQGNAVLYSDFNLSGLGIPWQKINAGLPTEIDYTDWQLIDVTAANGPLAMGDTVRLEFIAAGCSPSGHFGEVYLDGVGSTIPGLFVSGTGPAQANAGANITYTLTYRNGSAGAETGVVITLTTPPNTTYQAIVPPPGAVCVTPAVGMAGTITCTFANPVAAGASGSMQITININGGAVGTLVEGNYGIRSTQESMLLGNKITTKIGCALDSDCAAGKWCNESGNQCLPTLANGTNIPSDPPHIAPTLNGTCTVAAGTLVCTSKVCDAADNKCGFLNGDGPCTNANAGVVCRSAVCDPDLKCGYAVNDGPCTVANQGIVCRSATCSVNGLCEPAGGCNVDADCAGGRWCQETTHVCTAKLVNGTNMPNDPPHSAPTLNGTCTVAAATLVCVSGVCDVDNKCGLLNSDGPCTVANGGVVCRSGVCDPDLKCGYAVGDGPCTIANGGTVCRSGACSVSGTCVPPGGCNVDADCSGGNWCAEATHVCTPKIANGGAIPSDPPHVAPTLNGMCTVAAATLVCVSGVCDVDNLCGYANGDGPCTVANGGVVCRSTACSVNGGVCIPVGGCAVDADCTSAQWCNPSSLSCVPKLPNGQPVPTVGGHNPPLTGTCTVGAGAAVCTSGVCDINDNLCGFRTGDGPCTGANGAIVCRSLVCATSGPNANTCEQCNTDANCSGGTPACSPTTNQCVQCTSSNSTQCTGTSPVCSAGNTCAPCNGDNGSFTSLACPTTGNPYCVESGVNGGTCSRCTTSADCTSGTHTGTICNTTTGACGNTCFVDTDCANNQWCAAGSCTAKTPNGVPLPGTAPINGTCTVGNGARVCVSGVCSNDNKCGYVNGDGPCTSVTGDTVCRSQVCATTGPNAGKCEACIDDTKCSGATPACNVTTNACVQCNATNGTACTVVAPVCNTTTNLCGPCNGDNGDTTATLPCGTTAAPTCFSSGANQGQCGKCTMNSDCTGHPRGPVCDTASGACGTACRVDSDCKTATEWCTAPAGGTGSCTPKLPNGVALPPTPTEVAMCSTTVGARVCISGVCDTHDDKCGYANGDGPCASPAQCRSSKCDAMRMVCVACTMDSECMSTEVCDKTAGACKPKPPPANDGGVVPTVDAGVTPGVDAGLPPLEDDGTAAGGGLSCALGSINGSPGSNGLAGFVGIAIAAGALARRRRRLRDLRERVPRDSRG